MTATNVTQDTVEATADVNNYKYIIGTIHRDDDDFGLQNCRCTERGF